MKKVFFLILIIGFVISYKFILSQGTDTANITITLTDKEGNPLSELDFDLLNSDKTLYAKCKTDTAGKYITKLTKGNGYVVFFSQQNKDWKFEIDVPSKPGPRSYKYSFKVFLEASSQVVYKTKSVFDADEDNSKCEVTVVLRDVTGMGLPDQPFMIKCKRTGFQTNIITDSTGLYIIKLLKNERYDLETVIDGNIFPTYFELSSDINFFKFNYEIDFEKIAYTIVDTLFSEKEGPGLTPVKTTILVINEKGEIEEGAEVVLEESNKRLLSEMTDKLKKIQSMTDRRKVYEVYVRKDGRTFKFEMLIPRDESVTEYEFIANVEFPVIKPRTFKLNIYFDSGKFDIRQQDQPELNIFADIMSKNPTMVIEIGGHTDDVGGAPMNQKLSENRARAVVEYIGKKGIDASRLKYKGYGESRPVASNKTVPGRQLNRRIEVTVLHE